MPPQLIFTCPKSTIEKLEKDVIISKLTMKAPEHDLVLASLLLTLNIFHTLSSVSSVDFEQVNLSWVASG